MNNQWGENQKFVINMDYVPFPVVLYIALSYFIATESPKVKEDFVCSSWNRRTTMKTALQIDKAKFSFSWYKTQFQ